MALQQRSEFCLKGFALVMLLLPANVGFQLWPVNEVLEE
jgi:hypothetical protein